MDPLSTVIATATTILSNLPWQKILSSVAEDQTKSTLKSGIQSTTKKLLSLLTLTEQEKSLRLTLQLFTESFLAELEDKLDLQAALPGYQDQLTTLLSTAAPDIAAHLHPEVKEIDLSPVRRQWEGHNLNPLPPDFNWTLVAESYARALRKHIQSHPALLEQIAQAVSHRDTPTHASLENFDDSQVATFVQNWLEAAEEDPIERTCLELQLTKALKRSPAIRELAGHLQQRQGSLAGSQIERDELRKVFSNFLEYYCAAHFAERFEKQQTLALDQLKTEVYGKHWQKETWHEVLRRIAGMLGEKQAESLIQYLIAQNGKHHKLANLFLAAECLGEVRNRQAIPSTDSQLKQLFQEKVIRYDAPYFVERSEELDELSPTRQKALNHLVTFWRNNETQAWLTSCATFDPDWIVRQAAIKELTQCWPEAPETLQLLQDRLSSDENQAVRSTALEALATYWRDAPGTLELLQDRVRTDRHGDVRHLAVELLAHGWKDAPWMLQWLLSQAHNGEDSEVSEAALQSLANGWKDSPGTLELLQANATNGNDQTVRLIAVEALARAWGDDPATAKWLRDLAQSEESPDARATALEELFRGWKTAAETLSLLRDLALNDHDVGVRYVAVEALALGWSEAPGILELFRDKFLNDSSAIRLIAIRGLAYGWKDAPGTLEVVRRVAQNDQNYGPRLAALKEIAGRWKLAPGTLELLQDRALNDQDYAVRRGAFQELARGWRDLASTLDLLQNRAVQDEDLFARYAAIRELAGGWKDTPGTVDLLHDRARNDNDESVRGVALRELARGWRESPQTLELLHDLASNDEHEDVRKAAREELTRGWPAP